jgi:predicted transcriptional regulator
MVDWEIEILNVLPCRMGEDFLDACKIAGIPYEIANQYLSILLDKQDVKIFNDTFILTESGRKRLEDFKSKLEETKLEASAISKKTLKEVLWEKVKTLVHPAQSFVDGVAYTSAFFPFHSEKSVVEIPCLITSDRKLLPVKSLPENLQLLLRPHPINPAEAWPLPYIQLFLDGKNEEVSMEDAFKTVRKKFEFYMDLVDERHYDFLSLWVVGTYFFQLFSAYPYVFVNGSRGCGKTKLLNLAYLMSFNGENFVAPSASSIFRVIRTSLCTLCIDEIEKINKKELSDIRAMLLSGYKRGLTVPRIEERVWGQTKLRVVERFEVFSPKMMANISGVENTLQDRCITIVLLKTDDWKRGSRKVVPDRSLPEWQLVRNKLYLNMMLNWKKVSDSAMKFSAVYDGLESDPDLDESFSKIRQIIGSRNLELWEPIFVLALSVSNDVFKKMVDLSVEMAKEKFESDIFENADINILSALIPVVRKDGWYKVSDLTAEVKKYELDWINSTSLGKALSRLKIRSALKKVGGRNQVYIRVDTLRSLAKKFSLDYESLLDQEPEEILSSKYDKLLQSISTASKEFPEGFTPSQLKEKLSSFGVSDLDSDKLIEKALREGLLFSPKPSILKPV